MKNLNIAKKALEAFSIYQINNSKEIKGGSDIIIIDDVNAG